MVVSAMNIAEITSTALLVKSLGIKKFFVTRAACPSNCEDFGELRLTKEQFKGYLEEIYSIQEKIGLRTGFLECYPLCGLKELEKFSSFLGRRCLAGVTNVTISPLGEVRPCSHLDFAYGSIFEENMPTIWQRMAEWRENSFLPSVCKSCKIIGICGGGCRMEAKTLNGDICGIDPFAEPENIDYVTEQLNILSRNKALKKMELPKSCMVNPALRVRSESFGGVLFVKDKSSGLVDHQAIAFLSELDKTRRYKTELIVKQAGKYFSNANLNRFVSRLFKEKILIASEGELT
jgi:radical SAM protein with 4Fe4S-binding SPASM domain